MKQKIEKNAKSTKTENYHHGDLFKTLVDEALILMKEKGTQGFTFRELSKRAGVSPTAHYRHFATKEDLFATIAIDGFKILTRYLESAIEAYPLDPAKQLIQANRNYCEMVNKYPQHMYTMFGDTFTEFKSQKEAVLEVGNQSFHTLLRIVRNCQIAGVLDPNEDSYKIAIQVLSFVHGFSSFMMQGMFKNFDYSSPATLKFIDEMTENQIRGLAPKNKV